MTRLFAFIALMALPYLPAQAAEAPLFNLISLQAHATQEVANDRLTAILYVEKEDKDPARLAESVNTVIRKALKTAEGVKTVQVRSGNYETQPVYQKTALSHWRARHELRIESKDFEAATRLIGKLQETMQLGSLSFSVSPESRSDMENQLIAKAIGAFAERASIVKSTLKGNSYRIKDLNISTGEDTVRPLYAPKAMMAEAAMPQVEAGTSRITVTVSGTIKLE